MATEGIQTNNFTGGLNYRADAFQLGDTESPDLLNVDVDPRGGFSQRYGYTDFNSSAIGSIASNFFDPSRLFAWEGNNRQLFLSANNKVFYTQTNSFTDMGITVDAPDGAQYAPWHNEDTSLLFISTGLNNNVIKWNGSTATGLLASGTGQWQAANTPNGGSAPRCLHIATHGDRMWAAHVNESRGLNPFEEYPDRLRFSQSGFPDSWSELDYIDVVGGGRGITGIVSFGDQLIVFKPRAVFAVLGYDEDTFQLVQLTNQAGAISPKAIAVTERNVYFFSWPEGLFVWDGNTFYDLFSKLRPVLDSGELNDLSITGVVLSYVGRKVYVGLPVGSDPLDVEDYEESGFTYDDITMKYDGATRASTPTSTFVFDETATEGGAWVRYQLGDGYGLSCGANWIDDTGAKHEVFAHPVNPYVLTGDRDAYQDTVGGVSTAMNAYYVTKWQDAGTTVLRKFWRRPEFLVRQLGEDTSLTVEVYHDWDRSADARTFTVDFVGGDVSGGYESWVYPDLGSDLVKGDNLGLANAVQLKITGPSNKPWGVNSITYKYNPRRSRV